MSNYAPFNNKPLNYINNSNMTDGINALDRNNLTIADIYKTPFLFLNEHHKNFKTLPPTVLNNNTCNINNNKLTDIFYSKENMDRIQKLIKKAVTIKSNNKIKLDVDQEEKDLFLAMKAVFIENAELYTLRYVHEVKRLNMLVVNSILPGIMSNVLQYYGYLRDINNPRKLIDRPINVSSAGRKTLPSISGIFQN